MIDPQPWFEYRVVVYPHHTDYAGIVLHGTYMTWLEEARVAYLRQHNLTFADWVQAGVDLPVVDLSLRYRQSLRLGDEALIRTRIAPFKGVRLVWDYEVLNGDSGDCCLEGTLTLATVDLTSRRVLRRLPPHLQAVLA